MDDCKITPAWDISKHAIDVMAARVLRNFGCKNSVHYNDLLYILTSFVRPHLLLILGCYTQVRSYISRYEIFNYYITNYDSPR